MFKRIQHLRSEKGFTLVELLVVVTILGVLSAVAVIAVGGSSKDSKIAACKADVATVTAAADAALAKTGTAPADIAALVSGSYLRSAPPITNGYVITDTSGVITVAPACSAIT